MTRTERTYYLVQALYHCSWSFTAPIYSLFLLSRGLDLLQINLVFATYLLAAFLFEVPTGAIADRFGRKLSFLLSCVVRASAFFYYYFADSFGEFLVAEFIDAIGTTLATGALDAWAVDGIRGEGDHRPKDRMFARAHMIARMPMMLSGLVAGYIAEGGLEIPFLAGTTFFLITALAGWTLMQDDRAAVAAERARSDRARGGVLPVMRAGWQDLRADATLRLLWWLTFVISFAALPTWHYWPPRMEELSGGSVWLMGWVFAGLNLSAIIGTILSSRLQTWRREWLLAMATLARAALLAVAALSTSFGPALAGILVFELGFAISEPLMLSWTSERATAARRATVLSLRSMAFTLGGTFGLVCIGSIAQYRGIPAAWLGSAVVLLAAAIGALALRSSRPNSLEL